MEEKIHRSIRMTLVVGLVVADRVIKSIALSYDERAYFFSEKIPFFFERFENPFLAFSIPFPLAVSLPFILAAFVFFIILAWRSVLQKRISERLFFACIFFGAGSNVYDRFEYGFVVDYVHIWILPVFNLADILIAVGILGLFRENKIFSYVEHQK